MESFFSNLKTERCNRKVYSTRDQAKADVFDYIERFYNARRRHSTIGYPKSSGVRKLSRKSLSRCQAKRGQLRISDCGAARNSVHCIRIPSELQWPLFGRSP